MPIHSIENLHIILKGKIIYKKTARPYSNLCYTAVRFGKFSCVIPDFFVVKMSNEHITNDELELLSLGLKFTPTPMNDPSTDIVSRIQPIIRNLPNGMQSSIANDISHLLHTPLKRDNLQPHQRRALKNLKAKKQRLRILPSDKGNATVLLSHEQYHSKMTEHMSSGPLPYSSVIPPPVYPVKLTAS